MISHQPSLSLFVIEISVFVEIHFFFVVFWLQFCVWATLPCSDQIRPGPAGVHGMTATDKNKECSLVSLDWTSVLRLNVLCEDQKVGSSSSVRHLVCSQILQIVCLFRLGRAAFTQNVLFAESAEGMRICSLICMQVDCL